MTPINNYQTWLDLQTLVNVQQNGQIPPSVFNRWYNEVNKMLFRTLAEKYELNQVLADTLSPFIVYVNVPVTAQAGQSWGLARFPANYEYFLGATIIRQEQEETCFYNDQLPIIDGNGKAQKYTDPDFAEMKISFAGANAKDRTVQKIDTQRWSACLNHPTKSPTWNNPRITQFKEGFRVAPKGITSIVLCYLKTPRDSVFNYTISSEDIAIYDSATSVQLEWGTEVIEIFLSELQKKYAAYIGDPQMFAMAKT